MNNFSFMVSLLFIALTNFFMAQDDLHSNHLNDSTYLIKDSTSNNDKEEINLRVYMDFHYAFDINHPKEQLHQFGSNPLHVDQFDIGYSMVEFSYKSKFMKTTLAFHHGGVVEKMYENENQLMKRIREISGEVYLPNKFSIEGGIMPAFYGYEGFINKENFFATRAVMTDFAPDFDLGARLNYRPTDKWTFRLQVANGWQTLRETNKNKSIGTLIRYETKKFLFNYGTMNTNESNVDSLHLNRVYNNFFAQFNIGKKLKIAPLWDFGLQRDSTHFKTFNIWTSACLNIHYQFTPKVSGSVRGEYFYDPHQIIPEVRTNTIHGFQFFGGSLGFEYKIHPTALFRIETRYGHSMDQVYNVKDISSKSTENLFVLFQLLYEIHYNKNVMLLD